MRWPTSSKSTPSRLLARFLQYGTRTTLRIDRARGGRAQRQRPRLYRRGADGYLIKYSTTGERRIIGNRAPQPCVGRLKTASLSRAGLRLWRSRSLRPSGKVFKLSEIFKTGELEQAFSWREPETGLACRSKTDWSAFPYSTALAPRLGYRADKPEPQVSLRNRVSSPTKADFAAGPRHVPNVPLVVGIPTTTPNVLQRPTFCVWSNCGQNAQRNAMLSKQG